MLFYLYLCNLLEFNSHRTGDPRSTEIANDNNLNLPDIPTAVALQVTTNCSISSERNNNNTNICYVNSQTMYLQLYSLGDRLGCGSYHGQLVDIEVSTAIGHQEYKVHFIRTVKKKKKHLKIF